MNPNQKGMGIVMNGLSKRQVKFIRLLLEEEEYRPILYYSKKLHVSDKTLKEDLKKIRAYVKQYQIEVHAKTGLGILLDETARNHALLLNDLAIVPEGVRQDSSEARRAAILKNLLVHSNSNTSIYKLSEQYFVSRTSIVNDLKYIEQWLSQFELKLERTIDGTRVSGEEAGIRKAMASFLQKFQLADREGRRPIAFESSMRMDNATLCGLLIGEGEIYYIYQYLISSGMEADGDAGKYSNFPESQMEKDTLSYQVATELTAYLSSILGADFHREEELLRGLMLHIRPMLNRLKYDIQISNPLLEEMGKWYPQMLGVCHIAVSILSRKYKLKKISMDEISNIATYYQTMLFKLNPLGKVLVVCHSGYGTSQLLAAKLRHEFSAMNIVDVVSLRKVIEMDLKEIDYIISTVPVPIKEVPHILISALLTDQDVRNIRNQVYTVNSRKQRGTRRFLLDYVVEERIFINEKGMTVLSHQYKNLCRATFLSGVEVLVDIPDKEDNQQPQVAISIWNNQYKDGTALKEKECLSCGICIGIFANEQLLKDILAQVYQFSLQEEIVYKMISCNSKKAVIELLERKNL